MSDTEDPREPKDPEAASLPETPAEPEPPPPPPPSTEMPVTDMAAEEAPAPAEPEKKYAPDISIDAALSKEAKKMSVAAGGPGAPILPRKNTKQIMYGAGAVVLLLLVLMVYSCQPKKGSMAFGICSTFLELNTPYPETLNYTELEGSRTAVRIYFTNIDPFGEYKLEMIECTFGPDEKMGMKLVEIKRNRQPVDPQLVRKFNMTLPTIMASDPYLVLPPEWRNPLVPEY
jgi:hypothetical protein